MLARHSRLLPLLALVAAAALQPAAAAAAPGLQVPRIGGGCCLSEPQADDGEYPWQVALLRTADLTDDPESQFQSQFCGGALIAADWVLTAAACVVDEDGEAFGPADLTVLTGTNDLRFGVRRPVDRVVVHPGYDPIADTADLALLHLGPLVAPNGPDASGGIPRVLVLPDAGIAATDGTRAFVAGWGATDSAEFPYRLMEAQVSVLGGDACGRLILNGLFERLGDQLAEVGREMMIPPEVIAAAYDQLTEAAAPPAMVGVLCAGTASGSMVGCGDTGGPLTIMPRDGPARLVGILVPGPDAGETGCDSWQRQPMALYTDVAVYADWLAGELR
jgi:secreted trypsin-like serine protease